MKKWTLAVIQDDFQRQDKEHNLHTMQMYIETCMARHPETKLLLFPEAALPGYTLCEEHVRASAERADGPSYQVLARLAKKYDIYIGYGFFEEQYIETTMHYFNSVNLIGPDGALAAVYQKMHLTPLEKHLFTPGNRLVTVQTELGKLGFLICWDMAFPELSRLLAKEGVEVMIAASAWERPFDGSYKRMAAARAMDNTVFLATCNYTGGDEALQFFGQSAIYGPDGERISEARTEEPTIVVGQIDLARRKELEEQFYSMRTDERTDLYSIQWKGE